MTMSTGFKDNGIRGTGASPKRRMLCKFFRRSLSVGGKDPSGQNWPDDTLSRGVLFSLPLLAVLLVRLLLLAAAGFQCQVGKRMFLLWRLRMVPSNRQTKGNHLRLRARK